MIAILWRTSVIKAYRGARPRWLWWRLRFLCSGYFKLGYIMRPTIGQAWSAIRRASSVLVHGIR